jgi:menaquinone-dependent protoporphyrinogen oxidase
MSICSAAVPFRFDDVLLLYASHDGQARRIATRISVRLAEQDIAGSPRDLAVRFPRTEELRAAPLIVTVAAVRYGRHLRTAEHLLAEYKKSGSSAPLVFVSVNLTARKPGRNAAETNQYLRRSLLRHGVTPAIATAVAGRLDYPRYNWLDRQIIRLIMKLTGGPTDLSRCTEFTDWDAVDAIAQRVAQMAGQCEPRVAWKFGARENRILNY